MISGDGYLLEVQASVHYTLDTADPFLASFEAFEPAKGLRFASEAALREIVGAHPFGDLLTIGRGALEARALKLITERASHSSPGIRVMAVALHDIHPPQEVVGAYHEVTRAMEGRSQKILQARAQGLRRVGEQVARDLLAAGKAAEAYALVVQHGLTRGVSFAEAEDPVAFRAELMARIESARGPIGPLSKFQVEEMIDPRDTRRLVCEWLDLAYRAVSRPARLGSRALQFRP